MVYRKITSKKATDQGALASRIDEYLKAYLEMGYFSGAVLVAIDDKVILKKGYGMANYEHDIPNTPDTVFRIASITKQFTAMAILQLQERGLLSINDFINKYMPDYPHGETITIYHLLTNTSGIPNIVNIPEIIKESRMYFPVKKLMEVFSEKPLEFEPGTKFSYSNCGYVILGYIIEKISGMVYEQYIIENILDKLGMKNTGCDSLGPVIKKRASGYSISGNGLINAEFIDMSLFFGSGSMYSTVDDLYLWDRALYSDKLLRKESLAEMFKPHAIGDGRRYGFGWDINNNGMSHDGMIYGFRTKISRYPDKKGVIILLSNIDLVSIDTISRGIETFLEGGNCRLPGHPKILNAVSEKNELYIGEYKTKNQKRLICTIDKVDKSLFIEYSRYFKKLRVEIFLEKESKTITRFFARALDLVVCFKKNKSGRVTQAVLKWNGEELKAWKADD